MPLRQALEGIALSGALEESLQLESLIRAGDLVVPLIPGQGLAERGWFRGLNTTRCLERVVATAELAVFRGERVAV
jgi:hypothetical protein